MVTRVLYYSSSETSPLQRNVYSIGLNGRNKKRLTPNDGTNTAVFSNGFRYYINYHSDANTPPLITLHDDRGRLIRVLEDNSQLKKVTEEYGFSEKEFFTFTTSEGVELNGYMIKPPDFDRNREYPFSCMFMADPATRR
jgi:dipeptidyl-peptidase 4